MSLPPAPRSLRARVALTTFAVLALVLLVAGAIVDGVVARSARAALDERLLSEAEALASLVHWDGQRVELDFEDETMTAFASPRSLAYFQVVTAARTVERSRSLEGDALPPPSPDELAPLASRRDRRLTWGETVGPHEHRLRVASLAVARASTAAGDRDEDSPRTPRLTVVVQVARSLAEVERARRQAFRALAVALPLALLLGTLGAFVVAARATAPVERLTRDAEAIAAGDLRVRLELAPVEGELRRLGEVVNRAFDRLEETIARERRFSADAAHELKTPLAVARSRLDLTTLREQEPREYVAAIDASLAALARLERVVESLLTLAQADAGHPARQTLDLRIVVAHAAEAVGPVAAAAGQRLEVRVPDDAVFVSGNEALLERVVENLLENAVRHGPSAQGVRVELLADPEHVDRALVVVSDGGAGFPERLLAHLFERFARADVSRSRETGGAGLGLAIVRAVARAHGGDVAARNRPGGGAELRVSLPRVAAPPES